MKESGQNAYPSVEAEGAAGGPDASVPAAGDAAPIPAKEQAISPQLFLLGAFCLVGPYLLFVLVIPSEWKWALLPTGISGMFFYLNRRSNTLLPLLGFLVAAIPLALLEGRIWVEITVASYNFMGGPSLFREHPYEALAMCILGLSLPVQFFVTLVVVALKAWKKKYLLGFFRFLACLALPLTAFLFWRTQVGHMLLSLVPAMSAQFSLLYFSKRGADPRAGVLLLAFGTILLCLVYKYSVLALSP